MRRSVTALICGLIGSLFSLVWGFSFGVGANLFDTITDSNSPSVFSILGWIAFLGAILGIIGSALSLKQAKKGAICLTIATVMCGALQVYLFAKAVSGSFLMTAIIIFLLPIVLLIVASIFDWISKDKEVEKYTPQTSMPQAEQTTQPQQTNQKSLEDELKNLKDMMDKGLITQEEFTDAKKNILEKYTK